MTAAAVSSRREREAVADVDILLSTEEQEGNVVDFETFMRMKMI